MRIRKQLPRRRIGVYQRHPMGIDQHDRIAAVVHHGPELTQLVFATTALPLCRQGCRIPGGACVDAELQICQRHA